MPCAHAVPGAGLVVNCAVVLPPSGWSVLLIWTLLSGKSDFIQFLEKSEFVMFLEKDMFSWHYVLSVFNQKWWFDMNAYESSFSVNIVLQGPAGPPGPPGSQGQTGPPVSNMKLKVRVFLSVADELPLLCFSLEGSAWWNRLSRQNGRAWKTCELTFKFPNTNFLCWCFFTLFVSLSVSIWCLVLKGLPGKDGLDGLPGNDGAVVSVSERQSYTNQTRFIFLTVKVAVM